MKPRYASLVALTAAAVLLSACEKPAPAPGAQSETVATVAGDKISQAELDLAVSRLGTLDEAQTAEARSKFLQALIDQRLVAQAAQKAGLDKDPAVEIAMAQASRQALAEAYVERNFKDIAKPTEDEIAAYYNAHPELFSQRRIYRIQELDLQVEPSRMAEVEARLKSSHSIGDFVNWVKEQGIDGKTAVAVKPAEQIPTPLLARLSQMKDGEVTVISTRPGQLLIEQLLESQLQPVTQAQVNSAIERALMTEKRKELMEADLQKLREATKVEYASGFAPAAEATPGDKKDGSEKADDKPAS